MRVVVSPVLVGERIVRIVSPVDSLLEVEEWVGEWWEPSAVTLTTASQAPSASMAVLRSRGVPVEDCEETPSRPSVRALQFLMLATARDANDPLIASDLTTRPLRGLRRKSYPGNARFRRGTATKRASTPDAAVRDADAAAERRQDRSPTWQGPWRRASDRPPEDSADTPSAEE
ncbi:MAG: hypothetical protein IT357_14720 [Gemmatimonadaceae bacterium]|nr:hypothetical protein [Gemmatimonadaceae bacterium]